MTTNKSTQTAVDGYQKYRTEYFHREILGGAISWWEKIKENAMGKELVINTREKYDSIWLNGERIK